MITESNEVDQHEVVTDGLMQAFENEGGDDMNMYRSGAIESMQVSETDSDNGEDDLRESMHSSENDIYSGEDIQMLHRVNKMKNP